MEQPAMRKLVVFNSISLDGYFTDADGDMSWAHVQDPEWDAFVADNAKGGGMLVLGRVTYEMMVQFWPTPMARKVAPIVADRMNAMPKTVFSRTLGEASWSNTTLASDGMVETVRTLKQQPGGHMTILGSGSIVAQLAGTSLIDEYQMVVVPIVLGGGRTMFDGLGGRLAMKLTGSRAFGNGNLFARYKATGRT